MYRILIAEDEAPLREVIKDYFERGEFIVTAAADGMEAIEYAEEGRFDLAILDVMMPRVDGFKVCKAIREKANIPVIFLTARVAEEDQLKGFELDADDYVTKPFSLPVLYARAETLLKRYKGVSQDNKLEVEGIEVDREKMIVMVDGRTVEMSQRLFELLVFFMENKGRIFTRDQLLDNVWGEDSFAYDRAVDTAVKRLRRLLGSRAGYIHTIVRVGYRFSED